MIFKNLKDICMNFQKCLLAVMWWFLLGWQQFIWLNSVHKCSSWYSHSVHHDNLKTTGWQIVVHMTRLMWVYIHVHSASWICMHTGGCNRLAVTTGKKYLSHPISVLVSSWWLYFILVWKCVCVADSLLMGRHVFSRQPILLYRLAREMESSSAW